MKSAMPKSKLPVSTHQGARRATISERTIRRSLVVTARASIDKTIRVTQALERFWSASHGWAPKDAADLLAEARLDRQLSFSHTLRDYLAPFRPEARLAKS